MTAGDVTIASSPAVIDRRYSGKFALWPRTQLSQRLSEHPGSGGEIFRRRIFVRPMADTFAAADKQHSDFGDAGHEKRVVIGAAHHGQARNSECLAGLSQRIYCPRARFCRWIGIDDFLS